MSLPLPRIVLATGNPSKLRLLQALIDGLAQGVTPSELDVRPLVQESGRTVSDNAVLKAKAYYDCTGLPALSGDSGLLLLDIPQSSPEQPGTQIRRVVHGEETTDEEMLAYYMELARRHGGPFAGCLPECPLPLRRAGAHMAAHRNSPRVCPHGVLSGGYSLRTSPSRLAVGQPGRANGYRHLLHGGSCGRADR